MSRKKRAPKEDPTGYCNMGFRHSKEMSEQLELVSEHWGITKAEFIRRAVASRLRLRMADLKKRGVV